MKVALLGSALGLGAALTLAPIFVVLLSCQAGCSQHTWSAEIEPQPAWVSCCMSLECLR